MDLRSAVAAMDEPLAEGNAFRKRLRLQAQVLLKERGLRERVSSLLGTHFIQLGRLTKSVRA